MEKQQLEVFSTATNAAIIRPPNRHFPGLVIQGDTLYGMWLASRTIASGLATSADEELKGEADWWYETLTGLLRHYRDVLIAHNHELPFPSDALDDE